jgi:hypothetical protein
MHSMSKADINTNWTDKFICSRRLMQLTNELARFFSL